MIDERGRGGNLPPKLENAGYQALCRAIWEQAIQDEAMLNGMGVERFLFNGKSFGKGEIERFKRSKWGEWLKDQLTITSIDFDEATRRGERMAFRAMGGSVNDIPFPYNGEEHTASEWSEIIGCPTDGIRRRWNERRGWANPHWLDNYYTKTDGHRVYKTKKVKE